MNRHTLIYCFFVLLGLLLFQACSPTKKQNNKPINGNNIMQEAEKLSLLQYNGYTVAQLSSFNDTVRYVLLHKDSLPHDSLRDIGSIIRTPIDRAVVFGTIYCSMIDRLGMSSKIVAVSDPQYITLPNVQQQIKTGQTIDIGKENAPNIEQIALLSPQVIFASPFQQGHYEKFRQITDNVIVCSEFTEASPLGRAEWIKFFGALFDCTDKADSIFTLSRERYNHAKTIVSATDKKVKLLVEKRYSGTWYLPAKESYSARMYRDAGARYGDGLIDANQQQAVALSFESVYDRYGDADVWIIKYFKADGSLFSYDELQAEHPGYKEFKAFKERRIYGCNSAIAPYFETTTITPDVTLYDLIKILYPDSLPNYSLRLFHPLQ